MARRITMPGALSRLFLLSVRDVEVVRRLQEHPGKRVCQDYEERVGVSPHLVRRDALF